MKKDGHIHTPYCPHGSKDSLVEYIEKAIAHGFTQITFTEHAPLPIGFNDPTPDKDSGMDESLLTAYFEDLKALKDHYAPLIDIQIGLEIDYIAGYEAQTTAFLNKVGPLLDDSILSVHFLKLDEVYTCIDYSRDVYLHFASKIGSIQAMYDLYYDTVQASILCDLGIYKPKRIGHPTLIHKFQLAHGQNINDTEQIKKVLKLMQQQGYTIDFNSAGLSKEYCKESYPPHNFLPFIKEIKLPFTFGSDAHTVKDLHQHYNMLFSD